MKQHYGCPSMGSQCADTNDTGEPCRYCKTPTVPVYPCACGGWSVAVNQPCVECAAKESDDMTVEQAKAMAESGWWKDLTPQQIVAFQLYERKLCMPFHDFHVAVEKALGRGVQSAEFGLNVDGLRAEFEGTGKPLTFAELVEMLGPERTIVVTS